MIRPDEIQEWARVSARRATHGQHDQEDAASSAVLKALEHLKENPDASPGFVRVLVKNAVLDYVDYLYYRNFVALMDDAPAPDVTNEVNDRLHVQAILRGVRAQDRNVLVMAAQGFSADEAAKRLGTTRKAYKSRLDRARATLRARHPEMVLA